MSQRRESVECTVLAAMNKNSIYKSIEVTRGTELLRLVDSLGLMITLTDIQESLGIDLDPQQYLQLFNCRLIGDVVAVLENVVSASGAD